MNTTFESQADCNLQTSQCFQHGTCVKTPSLQFECACLFHYAAYQNCQYSKSYFWDGADIPYVTVLSWDNLWRFLLNSVRSLVLSVLGFHRSGWACLRWKTSHPLQFPLPNHEIRAFALLSTYSPPSRSSHVTISAYRALWDLGIERFPRAAEYLLCWSPSVWRLKRHSYFRDKLQYDRLVSPLPLFLSSPFPPSFPSHP